ncbi:MAG: large conductance mechanosensitive channel protein MscL [bacterium]|nr:large conductance mechanosensitive channel protein MscL [bacterium]
MIKAFQGFKSFILRGNAVDLAVGVVIGAAFGSVVNALVKDLITPLIGAIAKTPDFSNLSFVVNGSRFMYGDFLNVIISFFLIAFTIYFFVILPMNSLLHKKEVPPTKKTCPECLSEIPIAAKRCSHCTQTIN